MHYTKALSARVLYCSERQRYMGVDEGWWERKREGSVVSTLPHGGRLEERLPGSLLLQFKAV